MAVNLTSPATILPVPGVRVGTACAGIKQSKNDDLSLFELAAASHCAAVFTRNAFCAAPVVVAREHLPQARYWLINSGNANAGTGASGLHAARDCCAAVSRVAGCAPQAVMPFSTGVIGQALPVDNIRAALPRVYANLAPDNWLKAATAIMTTDTLPKGISVQTQIDGKTVTVSGISKGAGMIRPDMATMLAFIATDAAVAPEVLDVCLNIAMDLSFNRISVDGDTSTNDACVLAATGQAGNAMIRDTDAAEALQVALNQVCQHLAQAIVRDGEGATKFISIVVNGGANQQECLDVAYTIAHSPLVKTAFFASDPNWGRILAAVGRGGLEKLDLNAIEIFLDDVCIVRDGGCAADYTEEQGQRVMNQSDITIRIELARGKVSETVWTCDFSYDYVKINAEYRT